jgi:serine/threonine protein kinase
MYVSFRNILYYNNIDTIKRFLHQGLGVEVYVVEDPDLNTNVVIKVFDFNTEESEIIIKMFKKETEVGLRVKESRYFVHYLEQFKSENYWCIKMEYCSEGDIKKQIYNGRIFTEEVCVYSCLKLLFIFRKYYVLFMRWLKL